MSARARLPGPAGATAPSSPAAGPGWPWWAGVLVLVGSLLVGTAMLARALPTSPEPAWGFRGFSGLFALSFGLMGAMLARRRPENRVGWIMFASGIAGAVQLIADQAPVLLAGSGQSGSGAHAWAAWVSTWIWVLGLAPVAWLLLVFPDGVAKSRRWGLVGRSLAVSSLVLVGTLALLPGPLQNYPDTENPAGIAPFGPPVLWAAYLWFMGSVVGCALAVVGRWRGAGPVVRAQLKWLALAGVPMAVFLPPSISLRPFSYLGIGFGVLIPVAVAIAVLRYRLYDIDELIGRTVLYASLTAVLAALYTAAIRVFTIVLEGVTGGSSEAPVILSTLVLAGAFAPVRKSLEKAVVRRFKPSAVAPEGSGLPVGSISVAELREVIRGVLREEAGREG